MKFPTHATIFRWKPAAWLRVSGADAANFLQGQFTNELRGLDARGAVYGLWLNVKGKVVADSFVLPGPGADEFWLGSYASPAQAIRERLESFVIADDVVIEDVTADWSAVALFGTGGREALAGAEKEGVVFEGRRARSEATEWVFPVTARETVEAKLNGIRELSTDEVNQLRIEAGIPAVPIDLGLGDLPNEGGLEADAISYTKGCYLGQEVMARLKSMGQVRRQLRRVASMTGAAPALPAPLFLGERQVGELRSAVSDGAHGFMGLAMVSLLHVTPGVALGLAPNGPATIAVVAWP